MVTSLTVLLIRQKPFHAAFGEMRLHALYLFRAMRRSREGRWRRAQHQLLADRGLKSAAADGSLPLGA